MTAGRQLLFSVKIELIFQNDECQRFILMQNLLSVCDLEAPPKSAGATGPIPPRDKIRHCLADSRSVEMPGLWEVQSPATRHLVTSRGGGLV